MVRFRVRKIKGESLLFHLHRWQRLLERLKKVLLWLWRETPPLEKAILGILLLAVAVSAATIAGEASKERVATYGGTYIEGVVGFPRQVNPLLAWSNPADSDLVKLIFSGLVRQGAGREFLPDLASNWQIEEGGKVYLLTLRDNVVWHDGTPLSADDVLFTVSLLKSEDYRGLGAQEWRNVQIEKIGDWNLRFSLPNPNSFFLRQLTIGILPQHLLQGVGVAELADHNFNLRPVGTGAYKVEGSISREQAVLTRFEKFYDQKPYIERIIFRFVPNEKALASLYQGRAVNGAGFREVALMRSLKKAADTLVIERPLPQYQALFFNPEANSWLKEKAIRHALAYGVDRTRIIQNVFGGHAQILNSPIPPGFTGHLLDLPTYDFSLEKAAAELKAVGLRDVDKDGFLEKDDHRLSFILTYREGEEAEQIVRLIQNSWQTIGVEVKLRAVPADQFVSAVVRPRDYEILLFGQDLGSDPDPYLYWHSSQTRDPGLNLALFYDKDIDSNLEFARTETRENRLIGYYHAFQRAFRELMPAVLLYQPTYLYLLDTKIRGVKTDPHLSSPSDRFVTIRDWYIKTKRG